jgi:hypothetical protein
MDEVFLDLETKRWFDEVGKRDPTRLGVSFVGLYLRKAPRKIPTESGSRDGPVSRPKVGIYGTQKEEGEFLGFFEKELSGLWPILEEADLIIGYNIKKFDYPVLSSYYPGKLNRFPTLDLLEVIREILGFRLKLNDLALATLEEGKTRPGSEGVWLFKEGRLKDLREYCLNDVKITRDLYDYGRKFGQVFFFDEKGEKKDIKIDWKKWLPKSKVSAEVQMSLGV